MTDLPSPSSAKRALPFKRTVKRKNPSGSPESSDSLSLFSHSKEFFPSVIEDQQRRALEKAAKAEREENERMAREREEEESALREQFSREEESAKKRRRVSLGHNGEDSDEQEHNGEDDDVFSDKPRKTRKSSIMLPETPISRREKSVLSSTKRGSRAPASHTQKSGTPMITLDDDSDDSVKDTKPPARPTASVTRSHKRSGKTSSELLKDGASGSDSDVEMRDNKNEDKEDEEDDAAMYVRMAMERTERARKERLAREAAAAAGGSSAINDAGMMVEMLVASPLDGIKPISFKVRSRQPLKVMFDTWVEQQAKREIFSRPALLDMFFTWKGNRVYPHTTLETLNIRPDAEGHLYPTWRSSQEGFHGRDKVFFEAWTKELYDDYQRQKERERKHELGEWDDGEDDSAATGGDDATGKGQEADDQPEKEKGVRVIFKAKDQLRKKARLRPNTTVAMMVKVFCKLAQVPADKTVELHFDGKVLKQHETVEDADIDDMDLIEVHIR